MQKIKCVAEIGTSEIYIGGKFSSFRDHLKGRKTVIVTDANISKLYGNLFDDFDVIRIGTGENAKNLATVEYIITELINLGCDRKTFLLGIGGGLVTDITGFAASIFMRGIDFGFVSTTLLSQVDASVGGKNGVNTGNLKNMIGVFRQPEFVICDPETVQTLDDTEYLSGLGEVIKHGFIKSPELLDFLTNSTEKILKRAPEAVERMVYESVKIKTEVVTSDPKESGLRKILNFGHTFGHAVELISGVPHGHAVAYGMILALKLSVYKKYLTEEKAEKAIELIGKFGYNDKLSLDSEGLFGVLSHDKKMFSGQIDFVLLDEPGSALIEKIEIPELRRWYHDMCSGC